MLTPLELRDKIATLVPPPRVHRHRYYGVLAPNAPLRAAVTALAPVPVPAPAAGTSDDMPHRAAGRCGIGAPVSPACHRAGFRGLSVLGRARLVTAARYAARERDSRAVDHAKRAVDSGAAPASTWSGTIGIAILSFARQNATRLNVSDSALEWNDDDIVAALTEAGSDLPENLIASAKAAAGLRITNV